MISTKRCEMISLQACHRDLYFKLKRNSKVRKYLGGRPQYNIGKKFKQMLNSKRAFWYVVKISEENECIGIITFTPYEKNQVEVSYEFLPKWWGKGYATETVKCLIDYSFEHFEFDSLIAITQSANKSSRKLLEKLGMIKHHAVILFKEEQSFYLLTREQHNQAKQSF